jgi:aspartyl-tRNA(Asn)/glutamyl-tRNA(Gln) amidotransferase subunit B
MPFSPVIGLETHVELNTATKMFCGCAVGNDGVPANTNICAVCVGHPGTLPLPNHEALRRAVLLGLALNGTITMHSKFDRKHYFYPDLPKAYQISQYDLPVMTDGELLIDVPNAGTTRIGIERMHLEEDSAKNIHGNDGKTYVDYNRASVPLCEIVTKPDFRSAAEAKAYVQELRLLVRILGISDGDLEKGHLRCDVNVSLREVDESGLPIGPMNPKTEIKNINSFRAIERAIQYEITRQTALWNAGTPPMITTTRGWNDATQSTEAQRTKEDSADYRYFPEPDIPPLDLHDFVDDCRHRLPELPRAKRARFQTEYGFKASDIALMVDDPALAHFTEAVMSELLADATDEEKPGLATLAASWLITKFPNILTTQKKTYATMRTNAENFAEFLLRTGRKQLTVQKGLDVLALMEKNGSDPDDAVALLGDVSVSNTEAIDALTRDVMNRHPHEVTRYRNGETKLLPFFLGQVMKASHGNADPGAATDALKKALES